MSSASGFVERIPYRRIRQFEDFLLNAIVLGIIAFILFPIYWTLLTSIVPERLTTQPFAPLIPTDLTLENYITIFFKTKFPRWLFNSLFVALGVVLMTTTAATLGGYGLTRIDIPYKQNIARVVLFGYMFPAILLGIPMYILWQRIGLLDSYFGLMLAETAITLPFSLWLMWKFFQSVPISLEESAQMAGATRFEAFYQIALPIAKPGMIAIMIFTFAISWGQYTLPRILIRDEDMWVLTVGLDSFVRGYTVQWPSVMAASIIMMIPPFVFIYTLQRYLLQGFDIRS